MKHYYELNHDEIIEILSEKFECNKSDIHLQIEKDKSRAGCPEYVKAVIGKLEVDATDDELSAICEYTGLSNAAATALYRSVEEPNGKEYLKAINALIEDRDNAELIIALHKRLSEKS